MFGISLPELLVVFTIVLLVFGPDKLPEVARTLGKLAGQFRKHSDSVRREFYNAVYTPVDSLKNRVDTELRALKTFSPTVPSTQTEEVVVQQKTDESPKDYSTDVSSKE